MARVENLQWSKGVNTGFNVATNQSDEWQTPDWLFDALDTEFGFTYDGAATSANTKCRQFMLKETAAYPGICWKGQRVFCNPPYSNIA